MADDATSSQTVDDKSKTTAAHVGLTARPASAAAVLSSSLPSVDTDPTTRVLKKGDLVRVAERREIRKKNRDGGLARIYRSIEIESSSSSSSNHPHGDGDDDHHHHHHHPFVYDIDFVLGGRIFNVERQDLVYTTADAEGMTERPKRNPALVKKKNKDDDADDETVVKPAAGTKKKRTKVTKQKTVKKKGGSTKVKHKGKKNGKTVAARKGTAAKQQQKKAKEEDDVVVVKDFYGPHLRDFEKCLARLEKQDTYGFFLGDPPPEHDEHYDDSTIGNTASNPAASQSAELSTPATNSGDASSSAANNASNPTAQSSELSTPTTHSGVNASSAVVFPDAPPFNFAVIRKRLKHGRYVLDRVRQFKEQSFSASRTAPEILHPKGVDWDQFRHDVVQMCNAAIARDPLGVNGGRGTLGHAANKMKNAVVRMYEQNGRRQMKEMENDEARHKYYNALRSATNTEAAMQGKWRKTPFPERIYERLSTNVVCAGLSPLDEQTAVNELQTSLPDSFVGLSYTYADTGQSEGWMKSVLDDTGASHDSNSTDGAAEARKAAFDLANDDGVVRAQVQATMTTLLIGVQDRVMTDAGVLNQEELKSANWAGDVDDARGADVDTIEATNAETPDIVEQPVWGIDCYTRKNITMCIEKDFDSRIALEFIEKWLLPAINACPAALAHNMINAARILECLPLPRSTNLEEEHTDDSGDERWSHSLLGKALKMKMNRQGPAWLKSVAHQLRLAICTVGSDFFRIHPKGHGAIVLQPKLEANTLLTFYRGEVYPSWRWGEKMDAIELTQSRLELRPNLPDFYNMALERPQNDPRGYGLLFVDASRKAGHGSTLSHSCEPTCEVRVAAVNGQLRLAMTTIRDLELGEELTFDYNAVTESLNEYRSAVCLCGHGRCRGSFLHFATADCYQQVLNRNSPIAVRFSNIIKGCAKQVMSEADESLLSQHGFGTAAFGAVSFKRDLAGLESSFGQKFDSIENVPIWLRTYVADTIRYIEYERRALPVMLLCNDLKRDEKRAPVDQTSSIKTSTKTSSKNVRRSEHQDDKLAKRQKKSKDEGRPIPGSKPEPVFVFFARKQRDFFLSQLDTHGLANLSGLQVQRAVTKTAGSFWKALSDEMKQHWKDQAVLEWEQNGGREKALLEAERLKRLETNPKKRRPPAALSESHGASKDRKKRKSVAKETKESAVQTSRISFQAADAEGVSAMEQRIQQLTQTLSRVGRVLDRHRESISSSHDGDAIHSPLTNLSDDDVVYWLWSHEEGPVRALLRACNSEKCVSPSLFDALIATEKKFSSQLVVEDSSQSDGDHDSARMFALGARSKVTEALLEFRGLLCNAILSMEGELRKHDLENSRRKAKARREAKKKRDAEEERISTSQSDPIRETVSSLLDSMVDDVVAKVEGSKAPSDQDSTKQVGENPAIEPEKALKEPDDATRRSHPPEREREDAFPLSPWLNHFSDRWKLEAAADLLLFYAHTNTFFAIKPYTAFESTPIEVYARELGNAVPRSVVETAHEKNSRHPSDVVLVRATAKADAAQGGDALPSDEIVTKSQAMVENDSIATADDAVSEMKVPKSRKRALCKPDDVITNVTVTYRGDYVLSQLLQWYNGGIGQKPGLPDLLGCVLLPSMSGLWQTQLVRNKLRKNQPTRYATEVRPMLLDWLRDPRKRGSPFEGALCEAFPGHQAEQTWGDAKLCQSPVGSPILDLLVTGDDSSIRKIAPALSEDIHSGDQKSSTEGNDKLGSTSDRLQSTVDEGMPAQAVANWVQCENPDCLKWRKLPWHVDVDALPETFYCSDNKWNPAASSCDAPEDKWDENDAQLNSDGIAKESDAGMVVSGLDEYEKSKAEGKQFRIGARFDVRRTGKKQFSTGEVIDVNFVGSVKRVLFHFPKTQSKHDEWIEIDSPRIAPLFSKQDTNKTGKGPKKKAAKAPAQKGKEKAGVGKLARTGKEQEEDKEVLPSKVATTPVASATTSAVGRHGHAEPVPPSDNTLRSNAANVEMREDFPARSSASGRSIPPKDTYRSPHVPSASLASSETQSTPPVKSLRGNDGKHVLKNKSTKPIHSDRGPGDALAGDIDKRIPEKKRNKSICASDRASHVSAGQTRSSPGGDFAKRIPKKERAEAKSLQSYDAGASLAVPRKPSGQSSDSLQGDIAKRIPKKKRVDSAHSDAAASFAVPRKPSSQSGDYLGEKDIAMRIPKKKRTETIRPEAGTSFTIPRKSTSQSAEGSTSLPRIPRKALPLSASNTVGSGMPSGPYHLPYTVTAATAIASAAFNPPMTTNFFQPSSHQQGYHHRYHQAAPHMREQSSMVPPRGDHQYFDERNYWQGQRHPPRKFGDSSSRKHYDDRR